MRWREGEWDEKKGGKEVEKERGMRREGEGERESA